MRKTWVQFLGGEDPLEKGMATHSSILAWEMPMDGGAWQGLQSIGLQSWTPPSDSTTTTTWGVGTLAGAGDAHQPALLTRPPGELLPRVCPPAVRAAGPPAPGAQPPLQPAALGPIFPSGCEGKLGVALESLQGLRDLT